MIRFNRAGAGIVSASLVLSCCAALPPARPPEPAQPTPWSRWIEMEGVRVHYADTDPAGPAQAVLIVHGFLGSTIPFESFIRQISAERRVVMPDLPGCGLSSPPAKAVSAEYYLQFLRSFTEGLGLERIVLVGNSLGAQLSLRYALRNSGQVEALVLGCPFGLAEQRSGRLRRARCEALLRLAAPWISRERVRRGLEEVSADDSKIDARIVDSYWAPFRTPAGRRIASQFLSRIAVRGQLEPYLPLLEQPALILLGELDPLNGPQYAARYRHLATEAQVVVLCGVGHLIFLEAPAEASRRIAAFLMQGEP